MKNFRQNSIMSPHVPIIQLQQLMFCHFLFQQDFYHLPTPTRFFFFLKRFYYIHGLGLSLAWLLPFCGCKATVQLLSAQRCVPTVFLLDFRASLSVETLSSCP